MDELRLAIRMKQKDTFNEMNNENLTIDILNSLLKPLGIKVEETTEDEDKEKESKDNRQRNLLFAVVYIDLGYKFLLDGHLFESLDEIWETISESYELQFIEMCPPPRSFISGIINPYHGCYTIEEATIIKDLYYVKR